MTISKKLYLGFGSIVVVLVLLFVTNTTVVMKERSASRDASRAVEAVQALETCIFRTTCSPATSGSTRG
jgi:hypothetical protein